MPIPKVEMPTFRKYDEWNKVNQILCDLTNMDYDVGKARDIIIVIEKYHLDKSLFDYENRRMPALRCSNHTYA